MAVGVKVAHYLIAGESFALEFLEDHLFVEHVGLADHETRRVAHWLVTSLEPYMVADLRWVVPQYWVLVQNLGDEVFCVF